MIYRGNVLQENLVRAQRHYIFGYGSLINSISRSVTGDTGVAVAVKINGFVRHWSRISSDFGMSSVVVLPDENGACNGVLVEVDETAFASFDLRERGYQRVRVDSANLSFYEQGFELSASNSEAVVWLYQACEVNHPSSEYPVVFSYLDVILAGCLEYSEQFCEDFVQLTQGWHYAMLNDRQTPRYPRVQKGLDIDVLIPYIRLKAPISSAEISVPY